jgi:hypothetical protein
MSEFLQILIDVFEQVVAALGVAGILAGGAKVNSLLKKNFVLNFSRLLPPNNPNNQNAA